MLDIRCECGKIVCQCDHELVVIKCRHCKRFIFVRAEEHKVDISPLFINRSKGIHNHYLKTM